MQFNKLKFMIFGVLFLQTLSAVATVSSATLVLHGVVPEVTSLSTVSLPTDLDLRPGLRVNSEKIGQIQLKLNNEIEGIFVSSSTSSGSPENESKTPFQFSRPFILKVSKGCRSLQTDQAGLILSPTEQNIASTQITNLGNDSVNSRGIIENCDLTASWSSERFAKVKQKEHSGLYSMYITVTLVSQ